MYLPTLMVSDQKYSWENPNIKNSIESYEPVTGQPLPNVEKPSVSGFSELTTE